MPPILIRRWFPALLAVGYLVTSDTAGVSMRAAIPPTASTPFSGTPATIPGRIEAANFDNGGQNVAYFDNSSGNAGGAYRATDVDLEASSLGGVDVGWIGPGEWLRYSVNVQQDGNYVVRFNVACPVQGGTFHLEMNGIDVTGPLVVPNTGSWQAWQVVSANVFLSHGIQSATLVVDADGANATFGNFGPFDVTLAGSTGPYTGTPAAIPGTIAAANFDSGPAGSAYSDRSPGNYGGAYRSSDVDIQAASLGGYNVGWVDPGEWLAYTVNVAQSGTYTASFTVASPTQGGAFHLEMNGANVTGTLTVPNTGGWQSWQTVSAPVSLQAGQQTARLVFDSLGNNALGNFATMQFTGSGAPPPASSPYTGTPVSLPGNVEAVNFDNGPSGSAYLDSTAGNAGGAYRSTDVDIQASAGGGFNVGWTAAGEWLNYTVNVATAGTYSVQLRVATTQPGRSLHVGFNGPSSVWTQVFAPNTVGWQAWNTVSLPVTLGAGVQQMTIFFDTGGTNLGTMSVTRDAVPPPVTGTSTSAVWVTDRSGTKRLARQADVTFVAGGGNPSLPTIDVNDTVRYQQIDGFGGSFTDTAAWVLSRASAAQQSAILNALFDRESGIGISFLRQPIGGSDFSLNAFTYDDIDPWGTDYNLASFSINHDRAYILPFLRAALAINPAIKVMASPWTPPAWMKTEGSLQAGSLRTTAYEAYANYFVKFIQAYQAEGVPIDSLTVQNEPLTTPPYPSMYMLAPDQATFIGQNLGPALARAGLRPRIFAWDHNWDNINYPFTVLSNAAAAQYVSGVSFHCYAGQPSAMSDMHNAYPNIDVAMTECGDSSRVTFGDKLTHDIRVSIIGSLRNWARTVNKWNLVLDQNGGPKLQAGCINCRGFVTVDTSTGSVSFNEDYYAIGHASRFIRPGAYRIDSTAFGFGSIENVAAVNPDGSLVVIADNSADGPLTFQIRWRGTTLQYTLESDSVATFVWPPQ